MTSTTRARAGAALTSCIVGGLTGCADMPAGSPATPAPVAQTESFVSGQPTQLQPYFRQLYQEGERNAVLNFDRLGVAALAYHQYAIARTAFDQSILRIDAFRTAGADLQAAKSKFQEEASKDFKGEPYERGMAFYYRGLIYLHDGDFANAGASFARVNVEDSQAEGQTYQADYASMKFLNAWTLRCQGERSTSADLFAQATKLRDGVDALDYRDPALVIVETGLGPRKIGTGQYNEKLSWQEAGGDADAPEVLLSGARAATPVRAESLLFQATTRGGRPVEYLLAGKAEFKEAAKTTSDASAAVSMGALGVANVQAAAGQYNQALGSDYVAVGAALFSMFSKMAENSTKPAADTRAWESIPGSIWLDTPKVSSADHVLSSVSVTYDGTTYQPDLTGKLGACSVAWVRTSQVPAVHADKTEKIDSTAEAKARLKSFQARLPELFQKVDAT